MIPFFTFLLQMSRPFHSFSFGLIDAEWISTRRTQLATGVINPCDILRELGIESPFPASAFASFGGLDSRMREAYRPTYPAATPAISSPSFSPVERIGDYWWPDVPSSPEAASPSFSTSSEELFSDSRSSGFSASPVSVAPTFSAVQAPLERTCPPGIFLTRSAETESHPIVSPVPQLTSEARYFEPGIDTPVSPCSSPQSICEVPVVIDLTLAD